MSTAPAVLAVNILDPHSLLSSFGPVGVAVVLFAETGLLIGFCTCRSDGSWWPPCSEPVSAPRPAT
jgi:hypothetical protein